MLLRSATTEGKQAVIPAATTFCCVFSFCQSAAWWKSSLFFKSQQSTAFLSAKICGQYSVIIFNSLSVSCQCVAYFSGTKSCSLSKESPWLQAVSMSLAKSMARLRACAREICFSPKSFGLDIISREKMNNRSSLPMVGRSSLKASLKLKPLKKISSSSNSAIGVICGRMVGCMPCRRINAAVSAWHARRFGSRNKTPAKSSLFWEYFFTFI